MNNFGKTSSALVLALSACALGTSSLASQLTVTCDSTALADIELDFVVLVPFLILDFDSDYCDDDDMTDVETAVNDNDTRIGDNEDDITDLGVRVTDNEDDITDLGVRVTTNEGNISTNTTNIATNVVNIAANALAIEDLRGDMADGLAMSNSMEVFLPDPGARFRLNAGLGYYNGTTAYGVTGAGRIGGGGTALYFGLATDSAFEDVAGKAGISWQW